MSKHRVVYLLNAGATQAAVNVVDAAPRVLTGHITEQVFFKIRSEETEELYPLSNVILNDGTDIEHIITLLDASYNPTNRRMARSLRRLFREEISEQLGDLTSSLRPNLYAALFDLHNVDQLNEDLAGVITLNYDQIADMGFAEVFGGVHYVAKVVSEHDRLRIDTGLPKFIKLHGSFNWRNQFPVLLDNETKIDEDDVLWIPPGLGKSKEQYPFDLLWGHAHELLHCDILRVVGCSLSPNDMHLVSMIFRTQLLTGEDLGYSIELVNYPDTCDRIANRYQYLTMTGIMDQPDFVGAIASDLFPDVQSSDQITETQRTEIRHYLRDADVNILDRWVRVKAEKLFIETGDISTEKNILSSYIEVEA